MVSRSKVVGSFGFRVDNLIAEGDQVVVERRGEAPTTAGQHYDDTYCIVVTKLDEKISQLRKYLDSELVTSIFG